VSSLLDKILGRPLKSSEASKEKLSVAIGVPVLGLDALASTAYGPEAALTILVPLGMTGLHYMPMVVLGILALLATLYIRIGRRLLRIPVAAALTSSRRTISASAPASLPVRR
jgi:hypothetical protein